MMRRVIRNLVACLILVSTAILGVSYTSAHAQTQTRHLFFSTYLGGKTPVVSGGSARTFAQNCACDAQGNTYVTGATMVSDLPVLNPWQGSPAPGSTQSAFVAKYDPNGQPLWCTYLGGDNQSIGIGVAAMPNGGGVVVVGLTTSDNFPTMNAYQGKNNATTGNSNYFVTVFDANGNPTYSTYLGGAGGRDSRQTRQRPILITQTMATAWRWMPRVWSILPALPSPRTFPLPPTPIRPRLAEAVTTPACASSTPPKAAPTR